MARSDQVLENPMSGQRIIFRKTARDTGGELLGYSARHPEYTSEYSRLSRVR
jgi:hypothetical protein